MNVMDYDYSLPERLIAQTPLLERTQSKLLALDKNNGNTAHLQFEQLDDLLNPGDLLVLNDTRVIPARLFGIKRDTGAKAEVLLLHALGDDCWEVLIRPGKKLKKGAEIVFGEQLSAVIEAEGDMGIRHIRFYYKGIFNEILDELGQMPLPPYIKERLSEKERYQTVYAKHDGSAAAPTAGLHFTEAYLNKLRDKGIQTAYVTLHVGLGTFRPVSVERIEEHVMHAEYYSLPQETANAINETRANGGRIIAVGTTSARTLETVARVCGLDLLTQDEKAVGTISASQGLTEIFLFPGESLLLVDALLTNFHLPKSTLLMLVSALASRDYILEAYRQAVEQEYRFFSFGDAMFIY
ncbi:tRNA preQ1(34) S-adenosylmethionine ribosyltransferase-isomerase QueA [Paenibacillus psychroresistens]|uniref:S-adenosylmethionine:tRNA ribosyltransferase-isomerase n=1 Tax=Paenibacillus psychroresistens TaxID=1778678 RepID=A0A6B8RJC1_9BACL|nr:tRNA preQ1(34) S-adenosylmethionine ribosyltransferase-isomerase QueA [Paenibacillus psychroresistens]QGQ95418.1 tRNA preQ1(34) S-adenosylmethionine ribosyltransferase-isomerase QueA [Paenibacillus psychroresistens]